MYCHTGYVSFSSVKHLSELLNVLDVTLKELPTIFSVCQINEHDHLLPFFHSNMGLLAQYEASLANCRDDHMKKILSAKRNKLAVLMREGRVPTSCDPTEVEFYSALLSTKDKALYLSEDDWSYR